MRKLLLIAMLLLSTGVLYAQTGAVTGIVYDETNDEYLIGANVIIEGTPKGTVTNLDGEFKIPSVPAGDYILKISYIGYTKLQKNITIVDGQTTDLGTINLKPSSIGLEEVQVHASVVTDRKTPIAISTVDGAEIDERFSDVEITDVVQNTPGVYSIQGSGGFGDNEVYIRGFDQTNVAFLVNGIPVNDMENGRMYWSNFAGLSEVTRQIQVQRGVGASKLAISSFGGTVNMITKPAQKEQGGRLEFQTGTGSWNQRMRFSYNSGELGNGWAFSFQGSRTTSNGGIIGLQNKDQGTVIPGAFVDAWSYYVAASKKFNDRHQLMFWAFGAPVNRGSAYIAGENTRQNLGLTEPMQNNVLGIYQGEIYNVRQNKINKPLMAATHYWDVDDRTSITTSLYYSFADVYSVQPRDAESALFLPERDQSLIDEGVITKDNLILWDELANRNRADDRERTIENPNGDINTPSYTGYESRYFAEARYNNHNWIGLISNFNKRIGNLSILAGIDLRHYEGAHFARVHELFGGDFIVNQSRFGDNFNRLEPNNIAFEGDLTNYNYDGIVNWASAFSQVEYSFDRFTAFATLSATHSDYTRIGHFWNDRPAFVNSSLGQSEKLNFLTYSAKAGISYIPNNRHKLFMNGGYFVRPPFFRDVFADARYSNRVTNNYTLEKVATIEAGYSYQSSKFRGSVNGYFTSWFDRNVPFNVTGGQGNDQLSGLDPGDLIPINLGGIASEYKGLEFEGEYNIIPTLEINGYISLGDWKYTSGSSVNLVNNQEGQAADTATVNVDLSGFRVGTVAQTTAGIGAHYTGIRSMYIGTRLNYADNISVRFAPVDVAEGFISADQLNSGFDDYANVDIYMGRYFDVGENLSGRISFSVQNVFDNEYIRWSAYFFNEFQNAYGYSRTYTIGLSLDF